MRIRVLLSIIATCAVAVPAAAQVATAPPATISTDSAASLYRVAREALNAGEYRRAAQTFAQVARQFSASPYRDEATYWRAFSLYRMGGIADLHEALQALDSIGPAAQPTPKPTIAGAGAVAPRPPFPAITVRRPDTEVAVLATRIRAALAARGDATAAAQIARTADASAPSCDEEDAQLRVEALNALVQMDPKNADPAIAKVLARRDACAVPLRRGAISLIARSSSPQNTDLLISTARNDPSLEVRAEAIRGLGRMTDEKATTALTQFAASSDREPLQRIAVRTLAAQESPAAKQALRSLMSRTDVSTDVRVTALHYLGRTDLSVADLGKMYDASTDRPTREEIVSLLEQRPEPQAADKLIEIARSGTDPDMRRRAIAALSRKKDPRTASLLMDILNK
jgi:HEAT repeat protein